MLDLSQLALFLAAALLLAGTPGSGIFYVATRTWKPPETIVDVSSIVIRLTAQD